MNPAPRLRYRGFDGNPLPVGCGRIGMENRARSFWQSRTGARNPPQLTDMTRLAREIRSTWPR